MKEDNIMTMKCDVCDAPVFYLIKIKKKVLAMCKACATLHEIKSKEELK